MKNILLIFLLIFTTTLFAQNNGRIVGTTPDKINTYLGLTRANDTLKLGGTVYESYALSSSGGVKWQTMENMSRSIYTDEDGARFGLEHFDQTFRLYSHANVYTGGGEPRLEFRRQQGNTITGLKAVNSGDMIGQIMFRKYNNPSHVHTGGLVGTSAGDSTTNNFELKLAGNGADIRVGNSLAAGNNYGVEVNTPTTAKFKVNNNSIEKMTIKDVIKFYGKYKFPNALPTSGQVLSFKGAADSSLVWDIPDTVSATVLRYVGSTSVNLVSGTNNLSIGSAGVSLGAANSFSLLGPISVGALALVDGVGAFYNSYDGKGIIYGGDYSATFVDASIVSKLYVDNAIKNRLIENYNNITSTTSPVTLSSTISDNLINQGGTQASFTLNLPASPAIGQVCHITFSNEITSLTVDGNGNAVIGSTSMTAFAGFRLSYKYYPGKWVCLNLI